MNAINLQPIQNMPPAPQPAKHQERERAALRDACNNMEGFFLSILLKEGMQPMLHESEDAPVGQNTFMDLTLENMAHEMSRQGSFGLADTLYDQLAPLL